MSKFLLRAFSFTFCLLTLSSCGVLVYRQPPNPLTQASAERLVWWLEQSNAYLVRTLSAPLDLNPSAALSGIENAPNTLAPICDITANGNTLDVDGDGVPVDATYEISCRHTNEDGSLASLEGTIQTTDVNDADAKSGYSLRTEDSRIELIDAQGINESLYFYIIMSIKPGDTGNEPYQISFYFNGSFYPEIPDDTGQFSYFLEAKYRPNNADKPFESGLIKKDREGYFDLFFVYQDRARGIYDVFDEGDHNAKITSDGLRYSKDCLNSLVGGSIRFEDSFDSTVEVAYNGCNSFIKNIVIGRD